MTKTILTVFFLRHGVQMKVHISQPFLWMYANMLAC